MLDISKFSIQKSEEKKENTDAGKNFGNVFNYFKSFVVEDKKGNNNTLKN